MNHRFLADENFPRASVRLLRDAGHDVSSIQEDLRGASDPEVLRRSSAEDRILLTFDLDFGELIFLQKLPSPPGIILFRDEAPMPEEPGQTILHLASSVSFIGMFSTVERHQVRQRRLP